tara:strand:+ start:22 stop:591 length:570 start_codon:yes stop_codon:yes gene_type:complete
MIIIFFGPPGAGKGTQASLISNKLKIPHLSTGEIFRNLLSKENDLAIKLQDKINKGELISDEITNQILSSRIEEMDCKDGFILDGYPRTVDQANFLKSKLDFIKLKINKILDIFLDEKEIIKRIILRSTIEQRKDDNENVIKTRISKYLKKTKPLSDHYKNEFKNDYHSIDGNQKIDKISADILEILKK